MEPNDPLHPPHEQEPHGVTGSDSDAALAALERLLRAAAAPLAASPAAATRHRHVAAAAAAVRGDSVAPSGARVARHVRVAGGARSRPRRRSLGVVLLRPVLAGGLALSLVAGLVVAGVIPSGPFGPLGPDRDAFTPELAMAPGFTPDAVPVARDEEYVILTVAADRADALAGELAALSGVAPAVLSVRTDRSTFAVPASVAARLADPAAVETVVDTPLTSLSLPTVQTSPPSWGLDRLDARDGEPFDGRYAYVTTGRGVPVYILDTGVRADHVEFGGRVIDGFDALGEGGATVDCNGHGTHVAGTVAGASFGVAKRATVVPVRVLGCDGGGFASSVIAGLNWVVANHPGGPGVINLSLGGPANSAVDRAVADATARGLVVVAAAGNSATDACTVSPARAGSALTTGATTSDDQRASFSNTGPCVDVFAPGVGIASAWPTSEDAAVRASGTSMAAPHVAGLAARVLQDRPAASPAAVREALLGSALSGVVGDSAGSADLLVNLVEGDQDECDELLDAIEDGELTLEDLEDGLPEACEKEARRRGLLDLLPDDRRQPPGIDRAAGLDRAPGLDGDLPPGLGFAPGLGGTAPGQGGSTPGLGGVTPPGLGGSPPGRPDEPPGRPVTPPGRGQPGEDDDQDGGADGQGGTQTPPASVTPSPPGPPADRPGGGTAPQPAPAPQPGPPSGADGGRPGGSVTPPAPQPGPPGNGSSTAPGRRP